MAALTYLGTTFDVATTGRIPTQQHLPVPAKFGDIASTYTGQSTAFVTGRGRFWGASWTLFATTNEGRLTASYYDQAMELRGFVEAGNGSGLGRTVVAISQTSNQILGSTVSDAVTGAFVLPLKTSAEAKVTVLAIPASGDMRNVVAYRDIVPVPHV